MIAVIMITEYHEKVWLVLVDLAGVIFIGPISFWMKVIHNSPTIGELLSRTVVDLNVIKGQSKKRKNGLGFANDSSALDCPPMNCPPLPDKLPGERQWDLA